MTTHLWRSRSHLNQVAGRTYRCRAGGYRAHWNGGHAAEGILKNQGLLGEIRPGALFGPTYRGSISAPSDVKASLLDGG